jgi:hypothetical protein
MDKSLKILGVVLLGFFMTSAVFLLAAAADADRAKKQSEKIVTTESRFDEFKEARKLIMDYLPSGFIFIDHGRVPGLCIVKYNDEFFIAQVVPNPMHAGFCGEFHIELTKINGWMP